MRATVNFNAKATEMLGAFDKVRVRVRDGIMEVKATDRVCGKNLPAGEKLLKLTYKNASTKKFSVRGFDNCNLEIGERMGLQKVKHGWIAIVANNDNAEVFAKVNAS